MSKERKIPLLSEFHLKRFLEKIKKSDNENDCWEWIGYLTKKGYGMFRVGDELFPSHRIAYFLHTRKNPEKMLVCHSCDNRRCCNPNHLFMGTVQDNSDDMVKKGRSCRGAKVWQAKLTEEDVLKIRKKYNEGGITQTTLGIQYNVSSRQIGAIVNNEQWRHLIGEPIVQKINYAFGYINA